MNDAQLMERLHTLNESELFYRRYRLAKSSPDLFDAYLQTLDREQVRRLDLIVPEWPDTVPTEYQEDSYFPRSQTEGIHVFKHNCFTPAIAHRHNFFEMFFVLEGRCVHQVRDSHAVLSPGDLCMIRPNVIHSLDVSDESVIIDVLIRKSTFRHYFYSILQGDNLLANFFLSTLCSKRGIDYLLFHAGGEESMHRAFVELCIECLEQHDYYSVMVNAIVSRIFVLLLRLRPEQCQLPGDPMEKSDTVLQIARYLNANTASATLGSLAEQFHYSPEYASRLIKQATGRTFIQLLTTLRMENAERMLRDTSLPITDIASAVGYESSEHFIRTFRKYAGLTPSGYRHKNRPGGIGLAL